MTRPGLRLRRLAARICSREEMARYIDPAIADLQFEWTEARERGRLWRARWCRGVHTFGVLQIVTLHLAERAWRAARAAPAPHQPAWRSAIAGAVVVVSVVSILLSMLGTALAPPDARTARLALYLLPSVLPLTVPAGFAMAIALALSSREQARRAAGRLVTIATAFPRSLS